MDRPLTLASLFDGSGGFPLGGLLCGIEPLWAAEVEPFPIRVTTKRLPKVKHYGDVSKIRGADVPPVDILTFGSPCQSFSVAGKREGMEGKSGLFYEAVRIVREMREVTGGRYPRFAVMENVPGIYSSVTNGKSDFLEVLNELVKTKGPALSVPMPRSGKWQPSGEIVGNGFSLGWRTFDAQFWGVPQRRRRCYIVLDLTGERAGDILFNEARLRGNPPKSLFTREGTAGNIAAGAGGAIDRRPAVAFEPGACSRLGAHVWDGEATGTLRADMGDNQLAVVYDARGNGDGVVANTITGDHNGHISNYTALAVTPKAYGIGSYESGGMKSANPRAGIYEADTSRTLDTSGGNPGANQGGIAVVSERRPVCYQDNIGSLCASDYKFPQQQQIEEGKAVVEQTASGSQYIVRRLTPTECALLQGFPPDWCTGLETPKPTKEDISFWREVWETHRRIMGESSTPKSRSQIIKWLRDPHSDAAEYKMWGNGVSLPVVVFVLGGIVHFS